MFKLCEGVSTKLTDDGLVVTNEIQNSEICLQMTDSEFEKILKGEKQKEIVSALECNNTAENLKVLTEYNSFIYVLMQEKIIESFSETEIDGRKLWLKSALVEITDGCNFRCPHCYVDKQTVHKLTLGDIKNLAEEMLELNCYNITLTGGEILTHNEFFNIYEYLYKKGFIIGLNSNGSLFNNKAFDLFEKMPPYMIEISLYGFDGCSYNSFTKTENYFDKVVENIRTLKDKNINVLLKNVITNSNKQHFEKIRKLANDLELEFRSDYISFPQINGELGSNPEQISPVEAVEKLKTQPRAKEYFINLYNNFTKEDGYVFKCKKKDDSIFINSKLEVCMCLCSQAFTKKYIKGNLKDCVFALQDFRQMKFDKNSKCKGCRLMPICRYCPAKFYLTTGDYKKPNPWFCNYANEIFNCFIKGYNIIRKSYISDASFDKLFEVIKFNMIKIGLNATDADKKPWIDSLKKLLQNEDFYFYVIYNNGEICGFVEVLDKGDELIICEIQLDEKVKGTKLILQVINFIFKSDEFKKHEKAYFNINKNNSMSNKTFKHLGGVVCLEKENGCKFEINRKEVEKYIDKLIKRK